MFPSLRDQRRTTRQGKQHNRKQKKPWSLRGELDWLKTTITGIPTFEEASP
jgi:hypothetical protein